MPPTIKLRGKDRERCISAHRTQIEYFGACGAGLRGFGETGFDGPAFQGGFVVARADNGHVESVEVWCCRGCSYGCGTCEEGCEELE